MADPARVMLGHPGPPGQDHAPDGSARHALQGRRQVRVAPAAVRRQAVAHRLARTPAQPSPGAAWLSACHVGQEDPHCRGSCRASVPSSPPPRRRPARWPPLHIHRSRVNNCLAPAWAQSLSDLLAAYRINGIWAGNWGVAPRVSRHAPWHRTAIRAYCTVHPQALYTAALCS